MQMSFGNENNWSAGSALTGTSRKDSTDGE
jgi:hypothetical protein